MTISRRTVVKGLGAGICSTALTPALAKSNHQHKLESHDTLRVQLAHQWGSESIAAVVKNTSRHSTTITDMNSVAADYGRFNFSELTENGPLTLAAGEEIHVPFILMGTPAKPFGHFDNRLQKHLKSTLKISTTNSRTRVTTASGPKIV